MARILLAYGTRQGHTAHLAEEVAITLEAEGHRVDVRNLSRARPSPEGYDAVVVGASVHAHGYEREVRRWVQAHREQLARLPNAFFSVSLTSAHHDSQSNADLDTVVDEFVRRTGWNPQLIGRFAGAIAYTRYNWFLQRVMRRIVRREAGGRYTDMSRDYDLTDYEEVAAFAKTVGDAVRVAELAA